MLHPPEQIFHPRAPARPPLVNFSLESLHFRPKFANLPPETPPDERVSQIPATHTMNRPPTAATAGTAVPEHEASDKSNQRDIQTL